MEFVMTVRQRLASDISGLTKPPLSRRDFISASAAIAAGYTLATGPVRAEATKTGRERSGCRDDQRQSRWRRDAVMLGGAQMSRSLRGDVLVAMEVFGLHEYIKDVTRRLAKLGALAVAPDYYFRKGQLAGISEIRDLMPLVNAKPDAELFSDLDATVGWAEAQGGDRDRIGIIELCRGGRTVWEYCAVSDDVKAGVALWIADRPADTKADLAQKSNRDRTGTQGAYYGLYGAEDQGIPPTQVEQMKTAIEAAGKTAEFKIYRWTRVHADYRPSYNKEAAEDAWQQMANWFKRWKVLT